MIAFRRIGEVDPTAIRRAAARAWPKLSHGSRRIPDYVVAEIVADYQRTGSLTVTGKRFGRSRSTLWYLLRAHGHQVRPRGGAYHCASGDEVAKRYAAYQRCGSLAIAGAMFGVTGDALSVMFRRRGLPVNPRGGSRRNKGDAKF